MLITGGAFILIVRRHRGEEYDDLHEFANHLRASGEVQERSIMQRIGYLRRLREVYDKPLQELTAPEIEGWFAELAISPSSKRTVLVYIRHALRVLNGGEDPPLSKRLPRPKGSSYVSRVKTPDELLTEDEVQRLIDAFSAKDMSAITALIYGLGARPSDVLNLKHKDLQVRQDGGRAYIQAEIPDSKGKPRVSYTAKPLVIRAVDEWLRSHPGGNLLFPSPRGGAHSAGGYRRAIKRAAERAGIEKNVYPYLLRHTRATELFELPAAVRDAQMGWTAGSPMWANYTHLRPDAIRDAILAKEGEQTRRADLETIQLSLEEILEKLQDLPDIDHVSVEWTYREDVEPTAIPYSDRRPQEHGKDQTAKRG